jgi:choline dehydrogenase-like flavoprotein
VTGFVRHGRDVTADVEERCDVCIVGSGAGGAVLAAALVARGLDVVMLEAGGAYTRDDFTLDEADAYARLYQGRGAWATDDLSVSVLQGRSVGGSTTVNWTTSYRTPRRILEHWRTVHGIDTLDDEVLGPHWDRVEARLNIHPWPEEGANANNQILLRGCRALGWQVHAVRRNVKGCLNSGYCGLGCPVDGKQAMHVTYLPDAVRGGLRLYADVDVQRFSIEGDRVLSVDGAVIDRENGRPTGRRVTVRPTVAVSSAGAINGPALLLRSGLEDGVLGRRTWIHPVTAMPALFEEPIDGFYGAPQSVASHEHVDRGPDRMGFFLEVPPVQPMLVSTASTLFGDQQRDFLRQLPHLGIVLALHVDGLLPGEEGGRVGLRGDGRPSFSYPFSPPLLEAMKASARAMQQVVFAAGAERAFLLHTERGLELRSDDPAPLEGIDFGPLLQPTFTAHLMGGCAMGPDPATSVVDTHLRHHRVPNLFVVDGSVLPTSLGVNPSETLYGIASWAADAVAAAV